MAPLCVFTPPVALSIADSPAIPIVRSEARSFLGSSPWKAAPVAAQASIHGARARAETRKCRYSISEWEPLLSGHTSPGLSKSAASSDSAATASAAIRPADVADFSFDFSFVFSFAGLDSVERRRSTSAIISASPWRRQAIQTAAALPQRRQRLGGSPKSSRRSDSGIVSPGERSKTPDYIGIDEAPPGLFLLDAHRDSLQVVRIAVDGHEELCSRRGVDSETLKDSVAFCGQSFGKDSFGAIHQTASQRRILYRTGRD